MSQSFLENLGLMFLAVFVAGAACGMIYGMWVADEYYAELKEREENE